jgi:hypothetical protein
MDDEWVEEFEKAHPMPTKAPGRRDPAPRSAEEIEAGDDAECRPRPRGRFTGIDNETWSSEENLG